MSSTLLWFSLLAFLFTLKIRPVLSEIITCGSNGYSCSNNGSDVTLTYNCASTMDHGFDRWIWSLIFLPEKVTILAIKNCLVVRVDVDCYTNGFSAKPLQEIRISNVQSVEFHISPAHHPGHLPPKLVLSNITKVLWTPDVFGKPLPGCLYLGPQLQKLAFDNVKLDSIENLTLSGLNTESISWNKVVLDKFPTTGMSFRAKTFSITNSRLPKIPKSAFKLIADQVILQGNIIDEIEEGAFSVNTSLFEFRNNTVGKINTHGLQVQANRTHLTGNTFGRLESESLALIQPGQKELKNDSEILYEFSENSVIQMKENSLHPDYSAFKAVAAELKIEGNVIPCNCLLPFEDPMEDRSRPWWEHYFRELYLSESNYCTGAPQCSLRQVLPVLHRRSCHDFVTAFAICSNITTTTQLATEKDDHTTTATATVSSFTSVGDSNTTHLSITHFSMIITGLVFSIASLIALCGGIIFLAVVIIRRRKITDDRACVIFQPKRGSVEVLEGGW